MKVVVIGTRGIPNILGGVETHCEELFPRIAKNKDVDITIIRRKGYVFDNLTEYKGVHLIDVETPKKKSLEAIIHTFKAIIVAKKIHADIVHIQAIGPALLTPFARMLGMKVVFTHHGPDYDRDKWGLVARITLKFGEMMGTLFANEVIVISKVINDILVKKYHRKDCHIIYNGVPAPQKIRDTKYLSSLDIEPHKYFLAVGRFVPEKNFHQLINAFSDLKQNNYRLVIAGDADIEDDYSRDLKKLAKENNVVLTGFIKGKKLYELLTNAYTFVLPSSHEGLPIALLEAMSYGLPVIVSDIPANLEIGLPKECYFQYGNEQQLEEKLVKNISKDIQPTHYSMQKYDWDLIAQEVASIYKELIVKCKQ